MSKKSVWAYGSGGALLSSVLAVLLVAKGCGDKSTAVESPLGSAALALGPPRLIADTALCAGVGLVVLHVILARPATPPSRD